MRVFSIETGGVAAPDGRGYWPRGLRPFLVRAGAGMAEGGVHTPNHSPKELTPWEDCARGADVLLHTVLAMDRT